MKIEYKLQDRIDLGAVLPVIVLMLIGLLAIYSATLSHPDASGNFQKQLFWVLVSIIVFIIIYLLPQQTYRIIAAPSFILSILLLLAVLAIGKVVYGAKSWISFGLIGFQPSEFAKIGTILFLAHWLSDRKRDINSPKDVMQTLAIGVIPIVLILLEPDMGTAMVFVVITLAMIFWSGISLFGFFVVLSPGIVAFASLLGFHALIISILLVFAALFFFKRNLFISASVLVMNLAAGFIVDYVVTFLKPHQQKRIESFIDPSADPLGSGYNALQAKVAIGSGGIFGKGFLEGNQTQLRFIPEQWTDFIYCVIGEEFGFFGSILVVGFFLVLFLRLLNLATIAKNKFRGLVVIGILTLFFTHFFINIGMNIGVTPVIGLPLPFLSYGGSSLMVNMILLGIAMNIYKNRKEHA